MLGKLIYEYRMLGFDKPLIKWNRYFNCYSLEICDPCGQWQFIRGRSEIAVMKIALKWIEQNWYTVNHERYKLVSEYPQVKKYLRKQSDKRNTRQQRSRRKHN